VAADLASAENGVVVFSSSTGKQFSIEHPGLGHGAFTAALLEAFDGKSDRPPPWLHVSDLDIWLAARVKELTRGAQTPTTTIPGERFTNPRVFMVRQPPGWGDHRARRLLRSRLPLPFLPANWQRRHEVVLQWF
jgi:hypothetical protein